MARHSHHSFAVERERSSSRTHWSAVQIDEADEADDRDLCSSCRCPLGPFEIELCDDCHWGDDCRA